MMQIVKSLLLLMLIGFVAAAVPARAASPEASAPKSGIPAADSIVEKDALDQGRIHDLYNNGDFEPVITVLEAFIKRNKTYSHSDSIFIAKHLAVVYSANPATREKGKYFMYRLLELLPSAKLIDMYVSDEVDRIFDKVREEFTNRQKGFGVNTANLNLPQRPVTDSKSDAKPQVKESENKNNILLWSFVAGGGVLLATGGYFLLQSGDDAPGTAKPEPVDVKVITPKN